MVAHAVTPEAMRRATLAGISTIEHGDLGDAAVFALMREKGVALCPTLAAGDAISQYNGWRKGVDPDPERIKAKKESFAAALKSGVTIVAGGDVGVFSHGENARELELMVEYGMSPLEVLKSVTTVNARVFGLGEQLGALKAGYLADLVAVKGRPDQDIRVLRHPDWVIKDGKTYKQPD